MPVITQNTDSLAEIVGYFKDWLEANKLMLGITDVYYGDQELIPRVPCICVEPERKQRELAGASFYSENTFTVQVIVYHGTVQSVQQTAQDCDMLSERVEDFLNTKPTLDGGVIHGFCISNETGFAQRSGSFYRANKITWQGLSKTRIGG